MKATDSKQLTPFAKVLIGAALLFAAAASVRHFAPGLLSQLLPEPKSHPSSVPPRADLPAMSDPSPASGAPHSVALPGSKPGCAALPEVRLELWAWNAQLGALLANGGPVSTEGSLMCGQRVNLKLLRQDDPSKMREDLVAFASALKAGEENPRAGAHFVAIMGDGGAAFLQELDAVLGRLGPEFRAKVIGSTGYSWGEDKLMGPPAWKQNPASSRGGLVAGVLRDGDWNIAQKWLAENRLCNNPDERTFDPDCLNWLSTPGYIEAAQQAVAGTCETRPVVRAGKRTGEKRRVCVQGVVTWTPGDVAVAQKRGGLVSIVSTREYRGQMPQVIIGIDAWMRAHRPTVEGMLSAFFEGADQVKASEAALDRAAAISAAVYGEEDAAYWKRYFHGVVETDRQGLAVELGGSRVNNLADNLQLFGMTDYAPGATNLFAATYTVFGRVVVAQYPELVPTFPKVEEVLDTSYLDALAQKGAKLSRPDLPSFAASAPLARVVSRGSWSIGFRTGQAGFTPEADAALRELFDQLVIAGGAAVEIHGHTDSVGDPRANQALSEARAFAVKRWLEERSSANFPDGRVRVFAHGQENPVAPNATAEGRAKNRRVEVVLGMTM